LEYIRSISSLSHDFFPEVAQTIVHLGIDLDTVLAKATLADAFLAGIGQTGPAA